MNIIRISESTQTVKRLFKQSTGVLSKKLKFGCDANISYCRDHANPTDWFVSAHPSPGHPNNEKGAADFEATRWVTVSDVILSEVMADNASILQDEDGAYSDWVEITNNGTSGFDLTGFALSNDRNDLFHWRFPQITLLPGQNLIVFCSGKNKTDPHGNLHTNFKINRSTDSLFFANSQGQIVDYVEIHGLQKILHLFRCLVPGSYGTANAGLSKHTGRI